jgi:undecaprenyl diphosphate synthase
VFTYKGIALDERRIPRHLALIMDGNGRWAKRRGLPLALGHRAGSEAMIRIAEAAREIGVKILTTFAFSTENWGRGKGEIRGLLSLLKEFYRREIDRFRRNNTRLRHLGDPRRFPPDIRSVIREAERATRGNDGLLLNFALNYSGRDEIVRAARRIARDSVAGRLSPGRVDVPLFGEYLDTKGLPDPDLLIRTSGELRISNFLLWQSAYTEFYFEPRLWPDFRPQDLARAVSEYQRRSRRFGR